MTDIEEPKRCSYCLRITTDVRSCYLKEQIFSYSPTQWSEEPKDLCKFCRECLRGLWKYAKEVSR